MIKSGRTNPLIGFGEQEKDGSNFMGHLTVE